MILLLLLLCPLIWCCLNRIFVFWLLWIQNNRPTKKNEFLNMGKIYVTYQDTQSIMDVMANMIAYWIALVVFIDFCTNEYLISQKAVLCFSRDENSSYFQFLVSWALKFLLPSNLSIEVQHSIYSFMCFIFLQAPVQNHEYRGSFALIFPLFFLLEVFVFNCLDFLCWVKRLYSNFSKISCY